MVVFISLGTMSVSNGLFMVYAIGSVIIGMVSFNILVDAIMTVAHFTLKKIAVIRTSDGSRNLLQIAGLGMCS